MVVHWRAETGQRVQEDTAGVQVDRCTRGERQRWVDGQRVEHLASVELVLGGITLGFDHLDGLWGWLGRRTATCPAHSVKQRTQGDAFGNPFWDLSVCGLVACDEIYSWRLWPTEQAIIGDQTTAQSGAVHVLVVASVTH